MTTAEGKVSVISVKGNFDNCQAIVKDIFNDNEYATELQQKFGYSLTSANSINWGRLLPQINYSINSYLELVQVNNVINFNSNINLF
jgi:threonine synthase